MKGFDGLMEMAKQEAINQFGEDFNTGTTSTWYKLIAPLIMPCAYLEGLAISLKSARNIYTAVDTQLDDILTNDLVFRIQGAKAKGTAVIKGNGIIDIPVNSIQVKGSNGLIYTNTEFGRLSSGSVTLKFECVALGSDGNIPENNFASTIKAPSGINDVQNDTAFINGLDRETDYDYLQRYLTTVKNKEWSLPAIISAIRQLDGVKSCDGIRNNTNEDGVIPKKSIRIVVDGGDEQEIAETLYLKIHTANTVGSVEKQVQMTDTEYETVKFDRPKTTTIDYQYTIISPDKERIIILLEEYLNEIGVGEIVSAEEFRKKKLDSVTQINMSVLDLGFKKSGGGSYSSYLQLNFDEKGKAGEGAEL